MTSFVAIGKLFWLLVLAIVAVSIVKEVLRYDPATTERSLPRGARLGQGSEPEVQEPSGENVLLFPRSRRSRSQRDDRRG
jgi:hypothetical protein